MLAALRLAAADKEKEGRRGAAQRREHQLRRRLRPRRPLWQPAVQHSPPEAQVEGQHVLRPNRRRRPWRARQPAEADMQPEAARHMLEARMVPKAAERVLARHPRRRPCRRQQRQELQAHMRADIQPKGLGGTAGGCRLAQREGQTGMQPEAGRNTLGGRMVQKAEEGVLERHPRRRPWRLRQRRERQAHMEADIPEQRGRRPKVGRPTDVQHEPRQSQPQL
mmetsp:Transcript_10781/g.18879  ORF Transcript_10781/g.18879 Transcript_10781/m.18879 type:complete len:222 (+) Transcript_10781:1072-1737(+)